jgi:predicted acylesterase/phospholipase RssA
MVKEYAIKLIENLPIHMKNNKHPQKIDLVLDGGIFNGSYLIGALHFLKEMENQKFIKINRISSCSIGSVAAFLYYIDALDVMPNLYNIVNNEFKENYNLNSITKLKSLLKNSIPIIIPPINGNNLKCPIILIFYAKIKYITDV